MTNDTNPCKTCTKPEYLKDMCRLDQLNNSLEDLKKEAKFLSYFRKGYSCRHKGEAICDARI